MNRYAEPEITFAYYTVTSDVNPGNYFSPIGVIYASSRLRLPVSQAKNVLGSLNCISA